MTDKLISRYTYSGGGLVKMKVNDHAQKTVITCSLLIS
jgi:hypothetical protein